MPSDITPEGDAERQRVIDELPETIEVEYGDGTIVSVPYRATAQAQDDDWCRFRDSDIGRMILGGEE